uniref:Uncharacterized protein n=1 Tax=Ditylenchus dipsaci TaxID=166011 RepID=A0A915E5X1_9BILA
PEHIIEEVVSAAASKATHGLRRLSRCRNVFKSKVLSSGQQQQQEPSLLNYNQIRGDKFGGVYTLRTHQNL